LWGERATRCGVGRCGQRRQEWGWFILLLVGILLLPVAALQLLLPVRVLLQGLLCFGRTGRGSGELWQARLCSSLHSRRGLRLRLLLVALQQLWLWG